uniref:Rad60-SLD domain-containing protein n=1 Tax=Steinernema glaseri TaxID=37863 RepID=A0A1I8AML7_9BILA
MEGTINSSLERKIIALGRDDETTKINADKKRDGKRRHEDDELDEIRQNTVLIKYQCHHYRTIRFTVRVYANMNFEQIMRFFSLRMDSYTSRWRFMYRGKQIRIQDTPQSVGIKIGTEADIDVYRI